MWLRKSGSVWASVLAICMVVHLPIANSIAVTLLKLFVLDSVFLIFYFAHMLCCHLFSIGLYLAVHTTHCLVDTREAEEEETKMLLFSLPCLAFIWIGFSFCSSIRAFHGEYILFAVYLLYCRNWPDSLEALQLVYYTLCDTYRLLFVSRSHHSHSHLYPRFAICLPEKCNVNALIYKHNTEYEVSRLTNKKQTGPFRIYRIASPC